MTPRPSGHFCTFGLVFFELKSLLGIARRWSREKFAILSLKPRSYVRIFLSVLCNPLSTKAPLLTVSYQQKKTLNGPIFYKFKSIFTDFRENRQYFRYLI